MPGVARGHQPAAIGCHPSHSTLMRKVSRLSGIAAGVPTLYLLAGCADIAKVPLDSTFGPTPTLAPPNPETIPTIKIARARGWPVGATPTAAAGFRVNALVSCRI